MRKEKGITLIALIITIIVMLILVGVTLSITLGENGIIAKTQYAKQNQEREISREKVQSCLSFDSTGQVNIEETVASLQRAGGTIINSSATEITVEMDEYTFTISKNGNVVVFEETNVIHNHVDENNDGYCDNCGEYISNEYYEYTEIGETNTETPLWDVEEVNGVWTLITYMGEDAEIVVPRTISGRTIEAIDKDFLPSSVTSVTLQSNIKTIEESAFSDRINLQTVILSEGLETIGQGAFSGCTGLQVLTIPSTVTNIGISAFAHTNLLTQMTVPSSVTTVGANAFATRTDIYPSSQKTITVSWNEGQRPSGWNEGWNYNWNESSQQIVIYGNN